MHETENNQGKLDRRTLLAGGAIGLGSGALLAGGGGIAAGIALHKNAPQTGTQPENPYSQETQPTLSEQADVPGFGGESLPCHGAHQAGIVTMPAAHLRYIAYNLRDNCDRAALQRMFRVITDDIEALTQGLPPLADPEPELSWRPARLTITIGVGEKLVERVDPALRPNWLAPLPAFKLDSLGAGYDGGDLLLLIQADDLLPVAHAARMLHRDLRSFASVAWVQQGFRQARDAGDAGATMRNLFGQVDGTVNPSPAEKDFAALLWEDDASAQPWLAGGTALVLRRIRMDLDTWDQVDRGGREESMGRTLADGAPLSNPHGGEHASVDFNAKNALGLSVISPAAHIRRAHSTNPAERILRRAVNYDDGHEVGLLFACYQRDPLRQFVPIQQRLDEADLLNQWVTHIGSAVFAILPGFQPGENLAAALFK